jgi:hypothetical protein
VYDREGKGGIVYFLLDDGSCKRQPYGQWIAEGYIASTMCYPTKCIYKTPTLSLQKRVQLAHLLFQGPCPIRITDVWDDERFASFVVTGNFFL